MNHRSFPDLIRRTVRYPIQVILIAMVAAELWHFLGYDGVMIAFSWPSTPSTLAYMADLETVALSAFNLRLLLEFLAAETPAHRIHIMGQVLGSEMSASAVSYLRRAANLHVIDATAAEGASADNGHAYFRKSPWVSSDIFATLLCDLSPDQRGLVRNPDTAIWSFPQDYISRLKQGLVRAVPGRTQ